MTMSGSEDDYARAQRLSREGRYREALETYLVLAESEPQNGELYAFIGSMYFNGRGTAVDRGKAVWWCERAAEIGHLPAFVLLYKIYSMQEEWDAARNALEIAAIQGYSPALYYLGRLYRFGMGVTKDNERAHDYFKRAWARGHVFALRELAGSYMRGERGLLGIPNGLVMLARSVLLAAKIGWRDPTSERIQT